MPQSIALLDFAYALGLDFTFLEDWGGWCCGRYLWVGLLLVDLQDLPNKHLLNMDVAVVGDVGGDTASAMHHFFDASPQVSLRQRVGARVRAQHSCGKREGGWRRVA
jgi:hypothetical protein